jgi:hypothetical protein
VSYTVKMIPNAPSYFFALTMRHPGGLLSEVVVTPPIGRVSDAPATASHREPNTKVMIRSPPYTARRRKNHKSADPEVPIGKKALNAMKAVSHALRGYAGRDRVHNDQPTLRCPRAECVHANIVNPKTKISDPILFVTLATCAHQICILYLDITYGTYKMWNLCLKSSLYSLRRLSKISQMNT